MVDLFAGYNSLVRPVANVSTAPLEVSFSLALVLLIAVDEKNQILQANVWPTMRWNDYQMRWDPRRYDGIGTVRLPPDKVWLPDIVLFNNADGNYEVSFYSNVVVESNGDMLWVPPAIYKSSCTISVDYFPFDEQVCSMIFGSWTFSSQEVVINYLSGKRQVELNDYSESGIWDLIEAPGQLIQKKSKIAYRIRMRRKPLFFSVILIVPTILMALLSVTVFYLPAEADEKITLSISILLALVVFLLLVSKILPPTSSSIPLLAKYLLTTFCLNIVTILVTVVVVNIYFRGPTTHRMPRWVKKLFLNFLPLLLIMRRPSKNKKRHTRLSGRNGGLIQHYPINAFIPMQQEQVHHHMCPQNTHSTNSRYRQADIKEKINSLLGPEAQRAVDAVDYITEHIKNLNRYKKIKEEWKYISMVIDRLLLYVFFGITLGGTLGILLSAPNVFETTNQTQIIQELMKSAAAEAEALLFNSLVDIQRRSIVSFELCLDELKLIGNANTRMQWIGYSAVFVLLVFTQPGHVTASDDEEKLLVDKFRGYNSLIQPVKHINDTPIIVKIALQLVLLINVDEKDQIMHTNVWLTLKWTDFQMTWNPTHYGGLKEIRVSPDKVWLPDIVLFNNADGNYEVSFMCNVVIGHKGDMLWVPPAIFKSSCIISVDFFPFDEQTCHLIFGSWTYNENEIKLEFEQADVMDLSEYAPSAIWDVIGAPAALVKKRSRVEFQLRIRRKTLFYTVVLIIPTVLMAFLSMAVFFLPTDSGEKMTLTISVLLSIVVFLLLVSKILPPTSSTIPLMAKYLLLTMVLNVITILVTVIIINVYFRGPTTHRMPRWVKILFLKLMPRLLCMRRPKPMMQKMLQKNPQIKNGLMNLAGLGNFTNSHHPHCPSSDLPSQPKGDGTNRDSSSLYPLTPDAMRAMDSVEYITEHLKKGEERKLIKEEWKYVSMVIDRLLLLVFFGITAGGTIGIIFSAPHVFTGVDQQKELERLIHYYKTGGQ
ncbi:Acetylcholine receptor subunit beta-type unc-29 [Aphelenchoides besseyi]|nr:Acetylcholine receptor subunit beta-type unc-29 [Aphelenchoides besseyi]